MPNWKKVVVSGSDATLNSVVATSQVEATQLTSSVATFTGLSTQASETTALVINGSNVVGIRELGSNAFTSVTYVPETRTITAGNGLSGGGDLSTDRNFSLDTASGHFSTGVTTSLPAGTVSASSQVDHDQTANFDSAEHFLQSQITEVGTVTTGDVSQILPAGTVSASGQIDHDQTANFDAAEHFTQADITTVGTVTTGDVSQILPAGTISGSGQVIHDSTDGFVANEHVDHSTVDITAGAGLTGGGDITTTRTLDIVSSNSGIVVNADDIALDTGSATFTDGVKSKLDTDGVVSGSTFSSPSQGTLRATINGVDTDVDLGLQTGDNVTFNNLTVSGDLDVNGTLTTIDSTQVNIGDRILTLNANGAAGDGGLYVNDASTDETGSLLWDVSENFWIAGLAGSETRVVTQDYLQSQGVVSSSAQIDHDQTTNYNANEHFTQAQITTVGTVTSGDISQILPSGTISSSAQFDSLSSPFTGSFTGSFVGDGSGLTGLPEGVAPADISSSFVTLATNQTITGKKTFQGLSSGIEMQQVSQVLRWKESTSTVHDAGLLGADADEGYIWLYGDDAVRIRLMGKSDNYFNMAGDIGFGTTSPSERFHVNWPSLFSDTVTITGDVTGSAFTGSFIGDGSGLTGVTAAGTVSASSQIDHDQTTNFEAAEHFTQAQITEVGTVTAGNVDQILPNGTVSASSQVDGASITTNTVSYGGVSLALGGTDATPAFNLTDATNYSYNNLTNVPNGLVSASSQIDGASITTNTVSYGGVSLALGGTDATPAFDLSDATNYSYTNLTNVPAGLVSSSGQIDHDQTTNFDAAEHFTQANITTVGTVTTGDVSQILPSGTVSSSLQFDELTSPFTGSFTGSFTGDGFGVTGVVSASYAVTASYALNAGSGGGGGTGISWSQITSNTTASANNGYVISGSHTLHLPTGAVIGDVVRATGIGTGPFTITHTAGTSIRFGNQTTTVGSGNIVSNGTGDSIEFVCVANGTNWNVISSVGTFNIN